MSSRAGAGSSARRGVLEEGLGRLSLDLSRRQKEQLELYADLVLEQNKTYNLMKAESFDDFIIRHVLDSLAAAPFLKTLFTRPGMTVGDIGSGGGCPGLPLAVAFPEQRFVLVERMERRGMFLEDAVKQTGLSNTRVLCKRADDTAAESFDVEVLRAFHPFDEKNTKLLLRMLKKGGVIAAYKARLDRIESEMRSVERLVPRWELIPLEAPFLEGYERNLVVIRKA